MNIIALCHDCQKRHTYTASGHDLFDRLGEWREKHPPGRCVVEYIPDLGGHEVINRVHHRYGHNADIKLAYDSSAEYTISLASLASSSTFVAGQESTAVSNTSNNYLDYLVGGLITTGGTAPTADTSIRIYLYGAFDDGPTYPDVLDGTNSAETITDTELLGVAIPLFAEAPVDTSTNQGYYFSPKGIASYFGGIVPKNHGLFVSQNTGQALNSTAGNHELNHTGIYMTST